MCDYLKLIQSLNVLHQEGGGPFEPLDLPADTPPSRSLLCRDHAARQELAAADARQRARHRRAGNGGDLARHDARQGLVDRPVFTGIINTNSPLQLDVPMAEGLMTMAEHGQVNVITPFTLAGAMAPVTLAGALSPAACRGAGRHRADPDRAAGRAGHVWRLHLQCRHAVGRAGLRHAGIHAGRADHRPARPPDRRAVPLEQRHRRQRRRRAGRL